MKRAAKPPTATTTTMCAKIKQATRACVCVCLYMHTYIHPQWRTLGNSWDRMPIIRNFATARRGATFLSTCKLPKNLQSILLNSTTTIAFHNMHTYAGKGFFLLLLHQSPLEKSCKPQHEILKLNKPSFVYPIVFTHVCAYVHTIMSMYASTDIAVILFSVDRHVFFRKVPL